MAARHLCDDDAQKSPAGKGWRLFVCFLTKTYTGEKKI